MEYNDDFERRRAYISSREKLRKRRRTVHITILLIVLAVCFSGIGADCSSLKKEAAYPHS